MLVSVGDFGLATSSLAAVDPSDVSTNLVLDADMTLDVGTRLYIAPEVQSSHGRPRGQNLAKADMYSLGVSCRLTNTLSKTQLTLPCRLSSSR